MATLVFGIIGVLGIIISLLNWLEIRPQQISRFLKRHSKELIDIGKRDWLPYDIGMAALLWIIYGYLLLRIIQGLETVGDVLNFEAIIIIFAVCIIMLYTVRVVYKYLKGYYKR